MLDIKFIREHPEKIKEAMRKKKMWTVDVDDLLWYDKMCREILETVETWRATINKISAEFRNMTPEERVTAKEQVKWYKEQLLFDEKTYDDYKKKFDDMMLRVPNVPLDEVPEGNGDEDNVVIKVWPPVEGLELPMRAGDMDKLMKEKDNG
jgi:seryl-tRNA synthetase